MKFETNITKVEDKIKDFLRECADYSEEDIEDQITHIEELTDNIIDGILTVITSVVEEC